MKYYTGIGSRDLPAGHFEIMLSIGTKLAEEGYILRSGGAEGADTAFYEGTLAFDDERDDLADIYIPWNGFSGLVAGARGIRNPAATSKALWDKAYAIAETIHPNWEACSFGAKKLHARNCFQVLGHFLDNPSKFVICSAPVVGDSVKGGTRTAVELAKQYSIPVFNLQKDEDLQRIQKWLGV